MQLLNLFLKKELCLLGAATNRQNLKAVIFSCGRLLHPPSPVLPTCLRIARARPTKILRAITFLKKRFRFRSTPMSYALFFNLDLVLRMSEFRPVLFWSDFFSKGKLQVQSLVPSLSLNNLIPLTTFYSVVFLSFDKRIPLRIDKNWTPPDWQNWDPSELTKLGPLRIDKKRTPPD